MKGRWSHRLPVPDGLNAGNIMWHSLLSERDRTSAKVVSIHGIVQLLKVLPAIYFEPRVYTPPRPSYPHP